MLRQLHRLVDVIEVDDVTGSDFVERELCLLRVNYTSANRSEIMDVATSIFRGKVVDITRETMTFEVTGPTEKIDAFVSLMHTLGMDDVESFGDSTGELPLTSAAIAQ